VSTRRTCTSCVSGFRKIGWKCRNTINVRLQLTLIVNINIVMGLVDRIILRILALSKLKTTQRFALTFDSLRAGSAVLDAVLEPP